MVILDLGCGQSKVDGALGIDKTPFDGVDLICDFNIQPIPLLDKSADIIYSNHVLEHVYNPTQYIREIWRLLKADGELRAITPNATYLFRILRALLRIQSKVSPDHIHLFGETELRQLLERNGFHHIQISFRSWEPDRRSKRWLMRFVGWLFPQLNRHLHVTAKKNEDGVFLGEQVMPLERSQKAW